MSTEALIISFVLMLVFLLFSAFFSSSETAFISLQRVRILHLVNTGHPGAERMARRLENPEKTLSTVLLGNNLVNTAMAAIGTAVAVSLMSEGPGVLISTILVTVTLLVFGEVIPKTFASRHAEWLAFRYDRPFAAIEWVLFPLAVMLEWLGTFIINLSGGHLRPRRFVSQELLHSMISMGHQEGTVETYEARMLQKVLSFGNRMVKEIMTPRTEMVWIREDTTVQGFLETYDQSPRARFPVYKEHVDNVVGILETRDVIRSFHRKEIQTESTLLHLVRPARFVPETKHLGDLFVEMRESGQQMMLVVDEYGGIAGLVTLNQVAGAILGWVGEEEESEGEEFESLGGGAFQIDGGMRVSEANERLNLGLPEGDYETIAGFVLTLLGHIPKEGETIRFKRMKLTVSEMKGVKVEKITITRA